MKFPLFRFRILVDTVIAGDFNSLFTEMFRTSEVRREVQKFIMKFTNQFVKLAFDWLISNV